MSYFDDASLVFIPSGTKTSKAYSVKPIDGTGDLTFSRSNDTATRVNSAGLIEKVRTNLVLQSQTFDNASWTKTTDGQVTITANAATAPDGTTTAEKMIPSAIAGFHCVAQTITLSAGEVTISVFAKAAENSFLQIFDSLTTDFANFNLTTGAVGSTDVYVASIQSAGNGWFRCTATKVVPSGSFVLRYGVVTTATAVRGQSFTGNGTDGLFIWGAQSETGVATPYIATTSAAVSVGPVANVPRLDYLNSSCPRLLLEPQRTNFATYNEAFSNWGPSAGTITSNATTSPDGYVNADLFTEDTTTGYHRFANSCTGATGTTKTYSIYAKWAGGTGRKWLTIDNGPISYFDLENGVLGNVGANCTSSITAVGNGWYRCVVTHTASGVGTMYVGTASANGGAGNHLGNGQPAFYVWGAQCEANVSYPTSVIPTLGAAVTRGADSCSKTGISSLIGQTEGVVFMDFVWKTTGQSYQSAGVNSGTYVNSISFGYEKGVGLRLEIYYGASALSLGTKTLTDGERYKIAFAYKSGDSCVYINGVQFSTNANAFSFAANLSQLNLTYAAETFGDKINQALLFKTRLSNSDLAALTTL